jgi:AcrR family transcriptional regulator
VFWRQGYEGTSLADLTEAMGINRPSLYAAFGNKEPLFRRALDRYVDGPMAFLKVALEEPSARVGVEALLRGFATSVADPHTPRGCLTVQGALASSADADPIRRELAARRLGGQEALRHRLRRAQEDGQLPADSSPDDLARYFDTVAQGLAVQAVGGATREQLDRVVDLALQVWPA